MTKSKTYTNATNFRRALEERLNSLAKKENADIQKLRRQVAFDRLLARLFHKGSSVPWALKGGYAMELRIETARTTKDIDLAIRETKLLSGDSEKQNGAIQEELQKHASEDLGDFFLYLIGAPIMDLDATPYGGGRFPVEAMMDKRLFVQFHLDVGIGDVWMEPLESITAPDWLAFANVPAPKVSAISKEQQFAEKLHAYTLPRQSRQNSRVKDLVDLVLLIELGQLNMTRIKSALVATFERRGTHPLPKEFPDPPKDWGHPFKLLAEEAGLQYDLDRATLLVRNYFIKIG